MSERNRQPRRPDLSSVIGWIVFILIVAGGPLLRLVGRALGNLNLPGNLLPLLVGALVLLSVLVSAVRALSTRRPQDQRLPTPTPEMRAETWSEARSANAPMPPFGGPSAGRGFAPPALPDISAAPRAPSQPNAGQPRLPRFDPVISPMLLGLALGGLLLLGGLALLLIVQGAL